MDASTPRSNIVMQTILTAYSAPEFPTWSIHRIGRAIPIISDRHVSHLYRVFRSLSATWIVSLDCVTIPFLSDLLDKPHSRQRNRLRGPRAALSKKIRPFVLSQILLQYEGGTATKVILSRITGRAHRGVFLFDNFTSRGDRTQGHDIPGNSLLLCRRHVQSLGFCSYLG